jgi:hypothetical protein
MRRSVEFAELGSSSAQDSQRNRKVAIGLLNDRLILGRCDQLNPPADRGTFEPAERRGGQLSVLHGLSEQPLPSLRTLVARQTIELGGATYVIAANVVRHTRLCPAPVMQRECP